MVTRRAPHSNSEEWRRRGGRRSAPVRQRIEGDKDDLVIHAPLWPRGARDRRPDGSCRLRGLDLDRRGGAQIPPPAVDEPAGAAGPEVAVVAGGCFWGVQGVFQHVDGVISAVSGYDGGSQATAHYDMTSRGDTGHAESVRIAFDPSKISYGKILQIFFSVAHDPTELDRQGPDEGTQYRSAIFPLNGEQARVAKDYIAELDKAHAFGAPIVTAIEPGKTFYRAEDYHQNFLAKNPYLSIHRRQRSAEDRKSEAIVPRPLPGRPGAGRRAFLAPSTRLSLRRRRSRGRSAPRGCRRARRASRYAG